MLVEAEVFAEKGETHPTLFSKCVKREFGENRMVTFNHGAIHLVAVMPLLCDPEKGGLVKVGTTTTCVSNGSEERSS